MGNLVFGSGAEPGRASEARGGLTESPMERYYDATESDRERYMYNNLHQGIGPANFENVVAPLEVAQSTSSLCFSSVRPLTSARCDIGGALQIQDRSSQLRPVASECVCDWLRDTTGLDCGDRSWICNAPRDSVLNFRKNVPNVNDFMFLKLTNDVIMKKSQQTVLQDLTFATWCHVMLYSC